MSQDQQRNFTPRTKNALDEFKLRLSAQKLEGGDRRPTLGVSVISNNPRLDVYTNVPNDKNRGNIRAAMDGVTFFAFLEMFETALNEGPGYKAYIENKMPPRDRSQGNKPELVSRTVFGKDGEGVMYISVLSADESRPKVKFPFMSSYYHDLCGGDGQRLSKGEVSVIMARGWLRMLKGLVPAVMDTHYREPQKRDGGGGGFRGKGGNGGGGYNNNRGGGNGGGQKSNDFNSSNASSSGNWEDDFPM